MNKQRIREHLRTTHSDAELKTWFDPLALRFPDAETLEVRFPHPLFSRWFGKDRRRLFERELAAILGKQPRIVYLKPENPKVAAPLNTALANVAAPGAAAEHAQWSFDTFIYNKKNDFPVSMAREFAASALNPVYNPFVISGRGTCGKTHLLRAIAIAMAGFISPSAMYTGTVEEMNALFAENRKPGVFKRKMLRYKAIFIDNAQDLTKFPELQQELVFIGDAFKERKRPFVIAIDEEVDYSALNRKLLSRLESGLAVAVKKPDLDIRLRYTRAQCAANRLHLKKEFMLPLAQRFQNLRTIQGVVTKLAAYQKKNEKPLTASDLEKVMASSGALSGKPATPVMIINAVADAFSLTPEDISWDDRRSDVVRARQIAMYLCRELLGVSFSSLGRFFNGKNHATVLYACKKIKKIIDSDKDTHKTVTQIRKKFLPASS